jgi:ribonuclease HI
MIYTDGLGYRGAIGAAAILYSDGICKAEFKYQLGSAKHHTVFEDELTGIILGLRLVRTTLHKHEPFNTSIDNQATIKSLQINRPQPAQYLINEIKQNTTSLHEERERIQGRTPQANQEPPITFTWVAGHMDSKGDEAVDKLAKEAAEYGSCSDLQVLPKFLHN